MVFRLEKGSSKRVDKIDILQNSESLVAKTHDGNYYEDYL